MPIGFFADGLPVPEVEGWKPIGVGRLEWGVGNASTDFDLLLLEAVLKDNDIPCEFFPHRPNEGYNMGRVIPLGVWLYVPEEYAEAAEQFAADVAEAKVVDDDRSSPKVTPSTTTSMTATTARQKTSPMRKTPARKPFDAPLEHP